MLTNQLKKYKITSSMIAKWFGYSSDMSFRNSSAYKRHIKGLSSVVDYMEKEIKAKYDNVI